MFRQATWSPQSRRARGCVVLRVAPRRWRGAREFKHLDMVADIVAAVWEQKVAEAEAKEKFDSEVACKFS